MALKIFGKQDKQSLENQEHIITDGLGSDPQAIEDNVGPAGRMLINSLDKAVSIQASSITKYVAYLRKKKPDASPQELQLLIDKHFTVLATGSGAGAGAAAAIPGIGFFTGAAAIGAESLVFLDAAAWYTLASAQVRGVDIRDKQRRKALILLVLLGSKGSAIVDAFAGDLSSAKGMSGISTVSAVSRFSAPRVMEMNNTLLRLALKQVSKKFRRAWVGKIMPLGIGAVLGTMANRKLAKNMIRNSHDSLGPLPRSFADAAGTIIEH